MDIETMKMDIVSRFQGRRRRRPTESQRRTKSIRVTPETYFLVRIYAEAHDMTIRDAAAYVISVGAPLVH